MSGCYSPEASFASYNGTSGTGQWTMKIVDDAGGDTGSLTSWALVLCTTP